MTNLLPCPFCGGDDDENNATQQAAVGLCSFRSAIGKTAYRVECQCGSRGAADLSELKAIAFWNRRHSSTPSNAKREERAAS